MLSIKWKKSRKGLTALAAAVMITAVVTGCSDKKDAAATPEPAPAATPVKGDANEVVVTYKDGGKITRGEFDTFMNVNTLFNKEFVQYKDDPAFHQHLVQQLVILKVLASRADDTAKSTAETKTKTEIEQLTTYLGMQEGGIDKQLKDANLTAKDLEQFIGRSTLAITALEAKVTDAQIKEAYDKKLTENKNAYVTATVSHILIGLQDPATGSAIRTKEEALTRAKEVQDKLKAGGEFAALALEYSDDPGSKDKGGKYENVEIAQWVPEFAKAAGELPINQVSDPVETTFGYHIMKVESRQSKTFEELKETLRSEAAEEQGQAFVEKELPTLIETNKLPQPPAPQPAPAPAAPPAAPDAPPVTPAPAAK